MTREIATAPSGPRNDSADRTQKTASGGAGGGEGSFVVFVRDRSDDGLAIPVHQDAQAAGIAALGK